MDRPKILVVGEANIAARMSDHLRAYGEVTTTPASHFHTVPQGTAWVVILDGGPNAGKILSAAGHAGAKAVSVPVAWAHAEAKLKRVGFFASMQQKAASPTYRSEGLTQRPFAHVADAMAAKERERQEAARKAREATEKGLNPAPPPPGDAADETPGVTAPPPPVQEEAPANDGKEGGSVQTTPAAAQKPRERTQQSIEKELRLEQFFEWNPDLSLADASRMLAAVSPDGRAIAWNVITEARRRVRQRLGLDPNIRRYSQIDRLAPGAPSDPPPFTHREDAPAPEAPVSPPHAIAYTIPLPPGVESAARLLQEELERAGEVAAFTLTFKRGERPRIRWRPDIEGDVEL